MMSGQSTQSLQKPLIITDPSEHGPSEHSAVRGTYSMPYAAGDEEEGGGKEGESRETAASHTDDVY